MIDLEEKSRWVRQQILEMIYRAKKGHIGGSLSCVEILVALYYVILRENDRFILSKGHAVPALYPILADKGYFDIKELDTYCQEGSIYEASANSAVNGIEVSTGSLGQGLGIGAGMALAAKMDKKDSLVYVLLGDGDCQEGSTWEAADFATRYNLNNLIAIVDYNKQGATDYIYFDNLMSKWKSFGLDVISIGGHSFHPLLYHLENSRDHKLSRPRVLLAHTVKGTGVSFMERELKWHHGIPTEEEYERAKEELWT